MSIERETKYKELYRSVNDVLKEKFFIDKKDPEYYKNLGDVLIQMTLKCYILGGMDKENFRISCNNEIKRYFDYLYNEYHKDKFVFSDELRKRMEPFEDKNISECLDDPNFYKTLLKCGGYSDEEAERIMKDIEKKF